MLNEAGLLLCGGDTNSTIGTPVTLGGPTAKEGGGVKTAHWKLSIKDLLLAAACDRATFEGDSHGGANSNAHPSCRPVAVRNLQ